MGTFSGKKVCVPPDQMRLMNKCFHRFCTLLSHNNCKIYCLNNLAQLKPEQNTIIMDNQMSIESEDMFNLYFVNLKSLSIA